MHFCFPRLIFEGFGTGGFGAHFVSRTSQASRRLPGQRQRQAPSTATRPHSFGIQAESGVPLGVFQLPGSQDQQSQHLPKSVIPTQRRVTEQLTKNWSSFKVLRQRYAGTRFEEQRQLHLPQKHKATVADSTLRVDDDVVYWYLIQ